MLHLIRPSVRYWKQARACCEKLKDTQFDREWVVEVLEMSAPEYVRKATAYELGDELPKDWIPFSIFWLIDENKFIGLVSIRHQLTPFLKNIGGHIGYAICPESRKRGYGTAILRLALEECKKRNINPVLVTCDESNVGSRKIIEKNGGKFEDKRGEGTETKLRFWIKQ